jgi:hypothetical protein
MNQLTKYDAAKIDIAIVESDSVIASMTRASFALAEAVSISQTKTIIDVARAAEIYAKRQHLSESAIHQATSVKVEAMRKLGEILQTTPKATGAKGIGPIAVPKGNRNKTPTLEDLGLSKKESAVAQKLASLSDEAFEQVRSGSVTIAKAVAVVTAEKANPTPTSSTSAPVNAPEDEYTPLDEAQDHIHELQAMLAVANMGDVAPEDKDQAKNLIAELQEENRKLRANLKAVTTSRDTLMNELAMVKRQCVSLQAKLRKAA